MSNIKHLGSFARLDAYGGTRAIAYIFQYVSGGAV